MTDYIDIPDSDNDPESPLTSSLLVRNRDNPIAITEGSAGAPKIQPAAYADPTATGTLVAIAAFHNTTTSETSYTKVTEIYAARSGTVNVKFTLTASGGTAYGRIYIDGVAVGTARSTGGSATYNEDVTVVAGEYVQLYSKVSSAVNDAAIANASIRQTDSQIIFGVAE